MNRKGQVMTLGTAPQIVLLLVLIAMIAASGATALSSFKSSQTSGTYSYNATARGEQALDNFSKQTPTIGTIIGVSLIIVVVVGSFSFFAMRGGGI